MFCNTASSAFGCYQFIFTGVYIQGEDVCVLSLGCNCIWDLLNFFLIIITVENNFFKINLMYPCRMKLAISQKKKVFFFSLQSSLFLSCFIFSCPCAGIRVLLKTAPVVSWTQLAFRRSTSNSSPSATPPNLPPLSSTSLTRTR